VISECHDVAERDRLMTTRRRFSSELKAKLAIGALKGQQTINEIASAHDVHPNQVVAWKKHLLADAAGLFADKRAKGGGSGEDLTDRLYQQIGQLKVELDWLKKIRAWQLTGSDRRSTGTTPSCASPANATLSV